MKPLLVLLALLMFAPLSFGQVLPWRRMVEEKLQQQDRLIAQLLQIRQEQQIIIVPQAPYQQLPIGGDPRQMLPIPGAPRQPLPIEGKPRQDLPAPGSPQQPLPAPGQPKQELHRPQHAEPQTYTIRVPALYPTIPDTYYRRIYP